MVPHMFTCFGHVHAGRWGQLCISDEQYVSTALSYYLREAIREDVTDDTAMVMGLTGPGFQASQIIPALYEQLLGTTSNLTLLSEFEDHRGECQALDNQCVPCLSSACE